MEKTVKRMHIKGMNTKQILMALKFAKIKVDTSAQEVQPLISQYTIMDAKAGYAAFTLDSDPVLHKLNLAQQYAGAIIDKLTISNRSHIAASGKQLEPELNQLNSQARQFQQDHSKIKKTVAEIVRTMDITVTDALTKLHTSAASKDAMRQSLLQAKSFQPVISDINKQIETLFKSAKTMIGQYAKLADNGKFIAAGLPETSAAVAGLPRPEDF